MGISIARMITVNVHLIPIILVNFATISCEPLSGLDRREGVKGEALGSSKMKKQMGAVGHLRLNPEIARTVDLPGLNDLQVFVVVEPAEPWWDQSDGPGADQTSAQTLDDTEITNCVQAAIFTRGPPTNPRSTDTR
jgi:hypothetical protein